MVRFRLVALHLAIVVRDKSEAVWARRAFGMWLIFVGMFASACLLWWVPSPGIGVAIMGIVAALMTARKDPSGWEKAGWTFMMFALLLVEILAIRKDRREHDEQIARVLQEEVSARAEAKEKFGEIGNGINEQSRKSETQFEKTIGQQSTQFHTTMAKAQLGIDQITGGDSYVVVSPSFGPTGNPPTFPLSASACDKCRTSIPDAHIYVEGDIHSVEHGSLVYEGMINTTFGVMTSAKIEPSSTGAVSAYKITTLARNKPTLETLWVRFNTALQRWECKWHIERMDKMPYRNEKTGMAEGAKIQILEDQDWETNIPTVMDRSKSTIEH